MNNLIIEACKKNYAEYGFYAEKGTPINIGLWFSYEESLKNIKPDNFDSYEEWFNWERLDVLLERVLQIRDDYVRPAIYKYYRNNSKRIGKTFRIWYCLMNFYDDIYINHIATAITFAELRPLCERKFNHENDWFDTFFVEHYGDLFEEISVIEILLSECHLSIEEIIVQYYLEKQ